MDEIKIVPATPNDVRGITEVLYKTWLDTYPNEDLGITREDIDDRFKERLTKEGLNKRKERMANSENRTSFVAKDGEKIVGYCGVTRHPDKNQINAIYVLPEYQGKGLGSLLWTQAKEYLDPSKDISVSVATYNDKAINFYKRLGFEDTGKRFTDEKHKMKSGATIPEMEMVMKAH